MKNTNIENSTSALLLIDDSVDEQNDNVLLATQDISSEFFLISKGINGFEVVCKDIEEFEKTYLIKKRSDVFFKVNADSYIDNHNPDYDYEGCLAIPLADNLDLTNTTGYRIWGVAKKWDTSKEPHLLINQINVNLILGGGIAVFNNQKKNINCVLVSDELAIAKSLASLGYFTVYGSVLDEIFTIARSSLPESYLKIMISSKTPQNNRDFYINVSNKLHEMVKDDLKNHIKEHIKYIKNKIAEDDPNNSQINGGSKSTLALAKMNDVEPTQIEWLWHDWLALGKLTLLAGAGGCGKTNLSLALAAVITRGGNFPDGTPCDESGEILIFSMEDDVSDTLVPRLIVNGADGDKVFFIKGTNNEKGELRAFDPLKDIGIIESALKTHPNIKLLIIDPIVSLVSGDMNKANDVRQSLQPLVQLASDYKFAILGITHFSKGSSGSNPVDRILGSQAFTALARMVWNAAKQEDESSCILVRSKSNNSSIEGGIKYTLEQTSIVNESRRQEISTTKTAWLGMVDGYAKELLDDIETKDIHPSAVDKAKDFLIDILSESKKLARNEIKLNAESKGISWASVRRAKEILKIENNREENKSYWQLPKSFNEVPQLLDTIP